jgi:hypothetical protein
MLSKSIGILLKMDIHALLASWGYFYFYYWQLIRFLESHICYIECRSQCLWFNHEHRDCVYLSNITALTKNHSINLAAMATTILSYSGVMLTHSYCDF